MKDKQTRKLIKALENAGFMIDTVLFSGGSTGYDASAYTPAGEDWHIIFESATEFCEQARNFDIDEELELWLDAKRNGTPGVPSASVLLKDQRWKKRTLLRIAKGL